MVTLHHYTGLQTLHSGFFEVVGFEFLTKEIILTLICSSVLYSGTSWLLGQPIIRTGFQCWDAIFRLLFRPADQSISAIPAQSESLQSMLCAENSIFNAWRNLILSVTKINERLNLPYKIFHLSGSFADDVIASRKRQTTQNSNQNIVLSLS